MQSVDQVRDWWSVELQGMPGFEQAMQRVYAWFDGEIIDRPPIRFMGHNEFLNTAADFHTWTQAQKRAWWLDVEGQVEAFVQSIENRSFHGETFPVFFPNLGPDVYAAFYGAELEFGEVTSWSVPLVRSWEDIDKVRFDMSNEYFQTIEALTRYSLERCEGKFLVGYTDMHPGLDCVAAWRDPQQLCFDMIDSPEQVKKLADLAIADFELIYDHFDAILKAHDQLSVSWMGIPTFGRMHIPSCDFSTLISKEMFVEFGLPILQREVKTMTHNVFHMDGKGVARHLETILSVPEVHAIQWVQGVGDDQPIMQWAPFIKEIQSKGMPVIVDLKVNESDEFIEAMDPQGLFLWVATESEAEEEYLLKKISQWR